MKEYVAKLETEQVQQKDVSATLTLPFELRQKSRQRVQLDSGEEAALLLKRGTALRDGDLLVSEKGDVIRIVAAAELLSTVQCTDQLLFARACYHLGNRHMPLQIEACRLSFLHDHVLDLMLEGLGLHVEVVSAPFEPEAGAYGAHDGLHGAHGHHAH